MSTTTAVNSNYGHAGRPGQRGGSAKMSDADKKEMIHSARSDLVRKGMKPSNYEVARHVKMIHGEHVTPDEVAKHLKK